MQDSQSNNKRIAKNTIALYCRMGLSMVVGLFTSRVVLSKLGVEDYGIFGVVGSIVSVMAFLNIALSSATSRFITFELGKENNKNVSDTFSSALILHTILAVIIFVLLETIGVWFLHNKLVIPYSRMEAAEWVLQFSIATAMVGLVQVPYNATIMSHERMDVYAYVEILNSLLKMGIVYILAISGFDKLKLYSTLLFFVTIIIAGIYRWYCRKYFQESHFHLVWRLQVLKSMMSFSGWDLYGNMCVTANEQGRSFLINIFFGVICNAAVGIASSVSGVVMGFSSTLIQAVRPQIIKQYAQANYKRMQVLMTHAIKLQTLLFSLFSVPLIMEADYVLNLWLGNAPLYAPLFCQLILVGMIFKLISQVLNTGIHSTGNIKFISFFNGTIVILRIPITYLAYKCGIAVECVFWLEIIGSAFLVITGVLVLKHQIPQLEIRGIFFSICVTLSLIAIVTITTYIIREQFESSFIRLIIVTITYITAALSVAYWLLIDKQQRVQIRNIIKARIGFK